MNRSMISAAVSMNALQQKLDMIANNMANMNTIGYKKREASFQDVLTQTIGQHPDMMLNGRLTAPGLTVGGGVRLSGLRLDLSQGSLSPNENPLSVAIEGPALFEVEVPVGADGQDVQPLWTRDGQFLLSYREDEGATILTNSDGYPVLSIDDDYIVIPENADFEIDARGIVTYTNEYGEPEMIGQIKLMRVNWPEMMVAVGSNLYGLADGVEDQDNVLQQIDDFDAQENQGIAIRQYFTEESNVDLTKEMTELIMVQRAYQLNAQAISSGDMMMNLANQLRR